MYKGKKFSVVTPMGIYNLITELAKKESRTVSQMATLLIKDGLLNRGLEIPEDE
jgi:hypothetical protein